MAPSSKAKVHCIECGGEYTDTTFSRNRHLRSAKHQNGPAEAARAAAAPFKCYDCPTMKGFYKESLLKKHISKAHPAANTICGECGAEYKPNGRSVHLQTLKHRTAVAIANGQPAPISAPRKTPAVPVFETKTCPTCGGTYIDNCGNADGDPKTLHDRSRIHLEAIGQLAVQQYIAIHLSGPSSSSGSSNILPNGGDRRTLSPDQPSAAFASATAPSVVASTLVPAVLTPDTIRTATAAIQQPNFPSTASFSQYREDDLRYTKLPSNAPCCRFPLDALPSPIEIPVNDVYRLGIVPKQEDAKALMQEKGYKSGILKIAHLHAVRAAELAARLNYEVEWNLVPVSRRRMFIEKMREWAVEQALSVTEVDLVIRYEIFDYGRRHLDTMKEVDVEKRQLKNKKRRAAYAEAKSLVTNDRLGITAASAPSTSASTPHSLPPVSFDLAAALADSAASMYGLGGSTSTDLNSYSYSHGTDGTDSLGTPSSGAYSFGAYLAFPPVPFSASNYLAASSYGPTTETAAGRTDPLTTADSSTSAATPATALGLPTPPLQYYADNVAAPAASTSRGTTSTTRLDDRS